MREIRLVCEEGREMVGMRRDWLEGFNEDKIGESYCGYDDGDVMRYETAWRVVFQIWVLSRRASILVSI